MTACRLTGDLETRDANREQGNHCVFKVQHPESAAHAGNERMPVAPARPRTCHVAAREQHSIASGPHLTSLSSLALEVHPDKASSPLSTFHVDQPSEAALSGPDRRQSSGCRFRSDRQTPVQAPPTSRQVHRVRLRLACTVLRTPLPLPVLPAADNSVVGPLVSFASAACHLLVTSPVQDPTSGRGRSSPTILFSQTGYFHHSV